MPEEPSIPIQHDPEDGPAWRAAREAGCDMDLLEESLALTPTERLRLHTIAVRRLEILEQAMREAKRESGSSS